MAREVNIPEILPCAMYLCSQLPAYDIIHGDGRNRLSQEDQNKCWTAQQQLGEMAREKTFGFLHAFQPQRGCRTIKKCSESARENIRAFHRLGLSGYTYARVEAPLSIENFSMYKDNVCDSCLITMQTSHKTGRRAIWKVLPNIFGLGSWNEICPFRNPEW
jgi:hypothetical protein